MEKYITEIIIGIYTLLYLIVFLIQKSQIDKLKETNKSMKDFMDIFKIDEVKKYVELKSERIMMSAENLVKNEADLEGVAMKVLNDNSDKILEVYKQQIKEEHIEHIKFIRNVLIQQKKDERKNLVIEFLPKTKHYYLDFLNDLDNENS